MMGEMVRKICILSVAFGFVGGMIPERGVKYITEILCTCILVLCIFQPLRTLDYEQLSLDMAKYSEKERELIENADRERERMDRTVIEREYGAYIMDKADELGVRLGGAVVSVKWSTEGIWLPWEAYIEFEGDEAGKVRVAELIQANLGIPGERQQWSR